jgi:hypothetical protein
MGSLLGVNAWQRVQAVENVARGAASGRAAVESVARAVADGEPAIASLSLREDLRCTTAGVLTITGVRGLLDDGWVPEPTRDWAGLEAARVTMRMHPVAAAQDAPPPLAAPVPVVNGCVLVEAGGTLEAAVVRAGVLTVRSAGAGERTLSLEWADRFGVFPLVLGVSAPQPIEVAAPPEGGASLRILNPGNWPLEVCGLE